MIKLVAAAALLAPLVAHGQYFERVEFRLSPTINSSADGRATSCGVQYSAIPVTMPTSQVEPFTVLNGSVALWNEGFFVLKGGAFQFTLSLKDFSKSKKLNRVPRWIKFDDGQPFAKSNGGGIARADSPGYFLMGLESGTRGAELLAGIVQGEKWTISFEGDKPGESFTYAGQVAFSKEDRLEVNECVVSLLKGLAEKATP